jgi:hypothetical protein
MNSEVLMCVYCYIGDSWFRRDPPFEPDWNKWPTIPRPITLPPHPPWPVDKLKEYLEVLKQVKELEDKIGCPCEPNKADYIKVLQDRIDELEAAKRKIKKRVKPKGRRR